MSEANERPSVPLSSQLIRLFTEFPCAGTGEADFELTLSVKLSDSTYEAVLKHVEFRRKCMNQGFDNLLELLAMHKEVFDKVAKVPERD